MSPRILVACVLVASFILSGCIGTGQTDASGGTEGGTAGGSASASTRHSFSEAVGGSATKTHTFDVSADAAELKVRASWSVGGSADFTLTGPNGATKTSDSPSGGSARGMSTWYETDDPAAGEWKIQARVNGGATYAFTVSY